MSLLSVRYGLPWLLDDHGKGFVRALWQREIRVAGLMRLPSSPLHALKAAKAALDLVRLTKILVRPLLHLSGRASPRTRKTGPATFDANPRLWELSAQIFAARRAHS